MEYTLDNQTTDEPPQGEWNTDEAERVVNYYFPVEIVVAGSLAPQERDLIQAQIYQDLHDAIIDKLA